MTNRDTTDVILVHSMGKVGSSSIYRAAQKLDEWETLHTHQLNRKTLAHFIETVSSKPGHVRDSSRFLANMDHYSRIKVITGVRDPVARNISAFFENIGSFGFKPPFDEVGVDDVIDSFLRNYRHEYPAIWFDLQLRDPLGIDVFEYGLDFESAGPTILHERYEVLLLRAEDSNERKAARIAKFLDVAEFELGIENVGSDRAYSDTYAAFKDTFKPTREFLAEMYESRFAQYFYSQKELQGFFERWSS